jgi:hypothetical protein
MGNYIAHKRRKIKQTNETPGSEDVPAAGLRTPLLALQRAAERLELERARALKQARIIKRRQERQEPAIDRTSGRRRTAARAAGFALISATAGMRTLSISIERDPRATPDELWSADVRIEGEEAQGYRMKGLVVPANEDAIHLMRAVAPRIAEEFVLGCATPDADTNNSKAASILADSYIQKTPGALTLNENERARLIGSTIEYFEGIVLARLRHFYSELNLIVESLMKTRFLNHKKCDAALERIYNGFNAFHKGQADPSIMNSAHMTDSMEESEGKAYSVSIPRQSRGLYDVSRS